MIKLMKDIKNEMDVQILQNDIDKIVDWTRKWLMKLNDNKCKIMHIGKSNLKHLYSIESYNSNSKSNLSETSLERDLIASDLIWTHHVKYCANKANKRFRYAYKNI